MLHLDEGILSALLDGELPGAEQQEVEAHLRTCAECRDRLAELKGFMQAADELVTALDEAPARAATNPRVRRRNYRTLAWAASLVAAVGLGFAGRSLLLDRGALNRTEESDGASEKAASVTDAPVPTAAATPPVTQPPRPTSGPVRDEAASAGRQVAQDADRRARTDSLSRSAESADSLGLRSQVAANLAEAPRQGNRENAAAAGAPGLADQALGDSSPNQGGLAQSTSLEKDVEQNLRTRAAREAQAPPAPAALIQPRERATGFVQLNGAGTREITMMEAVRVLGGSIRLVDSLTPVRIELTAADSTIRVVYRPSGVEVWLDQRRGTGAIGVGKTLADPTERKLVSGSNQLSWNDLQGFYLTLTGPLPTAALAQIRARIH